METKVCECPQERVHAVQFQGLREDLCELKTRVSHLETTIARGVLLLVANLVSVIVTLARELAQ